MPFQHATIRTPTTVQSVTISLVRMGAAYQVSYAVQLADQNGVIMGVPGDNGDLLPLLSQAQINQLKAFVDSMWDKANTEFLG